MKHRARALLATTVAAALGCTLASAQYSSTIHSRSNLSVASSANMEKIPHRTALNGLDRRFMMDMAEGNRSEILLAKLAQKNGGDWGRGYGKDLEHEHWLALEELKKVAQDTGVSLPSDAPRATYAMYRRLSQLHGAAFDRAYRSMMIDDHREDIAKIQAEIRQGHSEKVRGYAVFMETPVKLHLKLAQQQTTMMGTSNG